ncbi:MAG: hypothetical protein ACM3JB_22280 [Acidobacteriaceae bacterium]
MRDTTLSRDELYRLGLYIASRPDLETAEVGQIEEALKVAGKLPPGDHFATAFHVGVWAASIRRSRESQAIQ